MENKGTPSHWQSVNIKSCWEIDKPKDGCGNALSQPHAIQYAEMRDHKWLNALEVVWVMLFLISIMKPL